jgi:hypothetical protein
MKPSNDDLVELRASAMPRAFRCPGSARAPFVSVSEDSEAGANGTAVHEVLRPLAEGGSVDWANVEAIAAKYGADAEEVRMLAAMAAKLWPSIADSFRGALTEVELSTPIGFDTGVTLSGHVDLLTVTGTVARAGDWKSGRKDSDYSHQMRAYGALVLADDASLTEVTVTVIWIRDGEIENYTMTRHDAEKWFLELHERVVQWDGVFHPGQHCGYCQRSHECEAANALVRRDVAAISDRAIVARAEAELSLMAPTEIIDLNRKAELVEKYADRVRKAIKAHVLEHGDIVADGVRLTIETEERRGLDAMKAWPVLEAEGFQDNDFAECMDLRVSRVEKRIAMKAGRGNGASAIRALAQKLESAKAVEVTEVKKLREKRSG